MTLKISVILTTHAWGRFGAFRDAIRSVESQSYDNIEIVCALDEDRDMATAARSVTDGGAVVDYHPNGQGLATARNRGAERATGDVFAFLDDDCVASEAWVAELVAAFENGALAAGGPAYPVWPEGRPWYLPREFDWLVGCGPYHNQVQEVRNTYGCNLAFRASVFEDLGGFDESLGKHDDLDQGEETELCTRLREQFGEGVLYRPDAVVKHRVFPEQLRVGHLLRRAYAQGRTKRRIGLDDEETSFLADVGRSITNQAPHRSLAALAYTAATGVGFVVGGGR